MPPIKNASGKPFLIVASLCGPEPLAPQARAAAAQGADLLEVRVDSLSAKDRSKLPDLLRALKKTARLPMIVTARSPREQGGQKGLAALSAAERRKLYLQALAEAEWIDVELSSSPLNRELTRAAHKKGRKVILSHHDFKSTPSRDAVNGLARQFNALSGDLLKVAAMPKSPAEVGQLLSHCAALEPLPRVFIAMGALGMVSRVVGFAFGSRWSYGFIGKSAAPGQIPVKSLCRYRSLVKP